MRPASALTALLALAFAGCADRPRPAPVATAPAAPAAHAPAAGDAGPWPFADSGMPEPPSQRAPWSPPSAELPAPFQSAALALFAQGLADPRGLEYREVEIAAGSVWSGGGEPVKTRAWVMPVSGESTEAAQRFGVSWSGLVYPLRRVGAAADLRKDVAALVKADAEERARYAKENPDGRFYRFRHAWAEGQSVAHDALLPLKAALLLRLGEAKLAREVWEAWTGGMRADTNDDASHLRDPYLMLATDWAWALFDRAICAHMRGDDVLALASARALARIAPAIEAEADRRGFERRGRSEEDRRHLGFLDQLPALLADQERRARAPRPAPPAAPPADAAGRVAALIAELDQVDARQWGQPGGVSLGEDQRVQALIKEGDAAVEPLLKVLAEDQRLTRSVHFWRDFAHHRSVLGVHEAAYTALTGILDASFFEAVATGDDLTARGPEGRRAVAEAIREYWQKWKGLPLEERWYRILADDGAPPAQWIEAARNIVQPTSVQVVRSSMVFVTSVSTPGKGPPALRGEALRGRKGPSVSELLIRRVEGLARAEASDKEMPLRRACDLAGALAAWDPGAGAEPLARFSRDAQEIVERRRGDRSHGTSLLARCVAELTLARAGAGDGKALDEYARWIRRITPDEVDWYEVEILQPMWRNPRHPGMVAAARALFGPPKSPWRALFEGHGTAGLLGTPMVHVPGFQEMTLAALKDRKKIGEIEIEESGHYRATFDNGGMQSGTMDKADPAAAPVGAKMAMRACDGYAQRIAERDGAPAFKVYWTEAQRDRAIEAIRAFVAAPAGP